MMVKGPSNLGIECILRETGIIIMEYVNGVEQ